MAGEKNLALLLKNMQPRLNLGSYVFCIVPADFDLNGTTIIAAFREKEGVTVVLEVGLADKLNLVYETPMAWITLEVHSALDAVGLTAAVSHVLAKENISCNVIAAYHHDHIFVGKEDAQKALNALLKLTSAIK
ncbi:MAG: ACT domain-containing protein [Saprospiraceae bacterium]